MKKTINTVVLLLSTSWNFAQVGVNTLNPTSSLNITGNTKARLIFQNIF